MNFPRKVYYKAKNTFVPPTQRLINRVNANANILIDNQQRNIQRPINSVILNGFWRSGTTISQDIFSQALAAKTYFEPFEPGLPQQNRYIFDFARSHNLEHHNRAFVALLMPYIDQRNTINDGLWDYLDSIILQGFSSPGLVRNRNSVLHGFRRAKCIKFVRSHFILSHLWERYKIPIIHIRRNPMSVVASLVKVKNWNQNGFNEINLPKLISKQVIELDKTDLNLVKRVKDLPRNLNKVQKITAYWCITELFAEKSLQSISNHAIAIQFESLMALGEAGVIDILKHLNLSLRRRLSTSTFKRVSKTTHYDVKRLSNYNPNNAYKKILSRQEVDDIIDVCSHFDICVGNIEQNIIDQNLYCKPLTINSTQ